MGCIDEDTRRVPLEFEGRCRLSGLKELAHEGEACTFPSPLLLFENHENLTLV